MITQHVFTTAEELQKVVRELSLKNKCKKVRTFEYEKSYEDYSITYSLHGSAIFNFIVTEDQTHLIVKKTAKNSISHIKFLKGTTCNLEYVNKHIPYLSLNVLSDVYYIDGTHRYNK